MKTFLLLREIYLEGFKNLGNLIVQKYFKFFSWMTFIMFAIVLYAFVFRISTGFVFD